MKAQKRLKILEVAAPNEFADAIFRIPVRAAKDAELLVQTWAGDSYIATLPPLAVENGDYLVLCRAYTRDLHSLLQLEDAARSYEADAWSRLMRPDNPAWRTIMTVRGARRTLSGTMVPWSGRAAEIVPGDRLEGVAPPGIFAGDPVPEYEVPNSLRELAGQASPQPSRSPDPSCYHFFFLDGTALKSAQGAILHPGAADEWAIWPPSMFPHHDLIFDELQPFRATDAAQTSFTSVLLMRCPSLTTLAPDEAAVSRRRQHARRLCVLLDALGVGPARIVGDLCVASVSPGKFAIARRGDTSTFPYFPITEVSPGAGIAVDTKIVEASAALAQRPIGKSEQGSLAAHLQRALDAIALGQSSRDLALGILLLWAGIESLLSPGKSDVTLSISIALLGLQSETLNDRAGFFEKARKMYGVRSNIVHAFDLPDEAPLDAASMFAKRSFSQAVQCTVAVLNEDPTIDQRSFARDLRDRVINGAG